jgi:hypothetical protein
MAAGNSELLKSRYTLTSGEFVSGNQPVSSGRSVPVPMDVVGTADTVGGTMYDIQYNGPAAQTIFYDPMSGIHVTWMFSAGQPGTDRNMRYNFYDPATGAWLFSQGATFMDWGVNAFAERTGFGNLDVDLATNCAYISAHRASTSSMCPTVGKDASPGSGTFEECSGEANADAYLWPAMGLTQTEKVHVALMDNGSRTQLFYSKIDPWCTWATPISIIGSAPDAGFPDYGIATSHASTKLAVIWPFMDANPPTQPLTGWYRQSSDDGENWEDPIELGFPPVFTPGTETLPTFDISSLYGYYDSEDSLHIVGEVTPFIAGQGYVLPAVVSHYCTKTGWSVIFRAQTETLAASVGQNTAYAARPTIAEGAPNEFVCVWEQFDSVNVEVNTDLLRADILGARSIDGGVTWGAPVRLATAGTTSLRYPSLAPHFVNDTCHILYLQDLEAGFAVSTTPQGSMTQNPVIHQKFWKGELPLPSAIAEGAVRLPTRVMLGAARPNPLQTATVIRYELPKAGAVSLRIHDEAGRTVRTLVAGRAGPGTFQAIWDGRCDNGSRAVSGVYFYTLTTDNTRVSKKLTLIQ